MKKRLILLILTIVLSANVNVVFANDGEYTKIEKKYQNKVEKIDAKYQKEIDKIEKLPKLEPEMSAFLKKSAQEFRDFEKKHALEEKKLLIRLEMEKTTVKDDIRARREMEKANEKQKLIDAIDKKEQEIRELQQIK